MTFRPAVLLLVIVLGLGLSAPDAAHARHAAIQITQVPLARLIANLKDRAARHPDQSWYRLNLARAYTMAYALDSDQVPLSVQTAGNDLSFAPDYSGDAKAMPGSAGGARGARARTYLFKAVLLYSALMRDAGADPHLGPAARLGHAWSLEQGGNKRAAMAGYRALAKETRGRSEWDAPARKLVPGVDWSDASGEAAGYLIAMLAPVNDAAEIAILQRQLADFGQRPRAITPLAIPLAKGTALELMEDRGARVLFDVDGRNVGQAWSWITPKAGWLAYDPKQNRKIDSGIRLFGNVSYWMFWENGYQALGALDDNRDGILNGAELAGLVIWVDANSDGVADPLEVKSLAQFNIAGLRYASVPLAGRADRMVYAPKGIQYTDGSDGPSYDIILHSRP